jgi:mono/diheme cytochrome c family protein
MPRFTLLTRAVFGVVGAAIACCVCVPALDGAQPSATQNAAPVNSERSVWDGVYTKEQAENGKSLYGAKCARCHDEGGDAMAPTLLSPDYIALWEGKKVRALYSRIISTMPSDDPGSLDEKTVLGIVCYLLAANKFPAGTNALERANDLNSITFTRPR